MEGINEAVMLIVGLGSVEAEIDWAFISVRPFKNTQTHSNLYKYSMYSIDITILKVNAK
jgi:hypothetical protein